MRAMKPWMMSALVVLILGGVIGVAAQAWGLGQLAVLGLITLGTVIAGVPILVEEMHRGEHGGRPAA